MKKLDVRTDKITVGVALLGDPQIKNNTNPVGATIGRPHFEGITLKNQKGITLIALIITIIVMLILVGVTINVALNGGLFTKAEQAANSTTVEAEKEALLSAVVAAIGNDGKVVVQNIVAPTGWSGSGGTYTSPKGNVYTVDEYGKITEGQSGGTSGEVDDDLAYVKAELEGKSIEDIIAGFDEDGYPIFKNPKIIYDKSTDGDAIIYNGKKFVMLPSETQGDVVGKVEYYVESVDDYYNARIMPGRGALIDGLTEKGIEDVASTKKLVIPKSILGADGKRYDVIFIRNFSYNTDIEQLEFENGSNLVEIGYSAFSGCANLSGTVNIPNTVTTISDYAFQDCSLIDTITIPNSITTIRQYAFDGCTSIESITIPSSVDTLSWRVFNGWTETQTIYMQGRSEAPVTVDDYQGYGWQHNWQSGCNANIVWDN